MLTGVSLAPATDSLSGHWWNTCSGLVVMLPVGEVEQGAGSACKWCHAHGGARCQWRALSFDTPPSWG